MIKYVLALIALWIVLKKMFSEVKRVDRVFSVNISINRKILDEAKNILNCESDNTIKWVFKAIYFLEKIIEYLCAWYLIDWVIK